MIIIIRVLIHHMIREFLAVQEARVVHRVHRISMTTPIRMIPVRLIPQVNQNITNGVEDYDDPDDYASDYAEEFAYDEFGDDESEEAYDYGYEEAYDYWMDERGDDESD